MQPVHEQRPDDLHDVLFGGVMRPRLAAFGFIHNRLEQGAKNSGGDARPVEAAGLNQPFTHFRVERRGTNQIGKQGPVHIGKAGKIFVQVVLALIFGGVEYLEKLRNQWPGIRPVFAGSGFQKIEKYIARLENPRVVGKQAKHKTGEKDFEVVAPVVAGFQGIVQVSDQFSRFDVHGVLVFEAALFHPHDEAELLNVSGQVWQGESGFFAGVAIKKLEGLKIT